MASFLNKLKYLSSQLPNPLYQFPLSTRPFIGGIPIKILLVVFEYELINKYLIIFEIIILYNW